MLPSFLSNMFWTKPDNERTDNDCWRNAVVEHTTSEEADDWLVITTQQTPIDNHHSPDCDGESVCSDGSWVITPAPAFQCSSLAPPSESSHPLEDLLIEHPTMSVYCCNQLDGKENLNKQTDAISDSTNNQLQSKPPSENLNNTQQQEEEEHDEELRLRNQQRRETVLRQNRQRQQLAIHMQIPLVHKRGTRRAAALSASDGKLPPPTKRALKRQNKNNLHQRGGKLHQGNRVQKCTFKAGRRRC